ncbi:FAD binding domain-containing protein [Dactylonectria macrodidyma]|uniref:FAD binding domain-containing protein n=1 Tax=Dactylonectria macrodidyma TaxID=307937 RepID=A0A9P9EQ90_9HYPO|nr:FAD binding domain-containing protein [Dactylonectria macrodidyma]
MILPRACRSRPRVFSFQSFFNRTRLWPKSTSTTLQFFASARTLQETKFDTETDILIVGSGGAGLTASLRAGSLGFRSIVIEKGSKVGGSTAYSGGGCWVPGNSIARAHGVIEDRANLLKYMEHGIMQYGDPGPASSAARRMAFLSNAPQMVDFLQDLGFQWHFTQGYPDYYPELPGASENGGRTLEPEFFDTKKLDDWEDWVLARDGFVPPIHIYQAARLSRAMSSVSDFLYAARLMTPVLVKRALGQKQVGLGHALIAQLLYLNKKKQREIWRNSPLVSLISEPKGAIIGATVTHNGTVRAIKARHGVLLCAGGFARNRALREKHGRQPASVEWTSVPPGDNGDAITAGIEAGAETALLEEAWWGPTIMDPLTGKPVFALSERTRPFCIIVDSTGRRYMNEAASYTDTGRIMYERHQEVPAVPSWLIMDRKYLDLYMLGSLTPRNRTKEKRAEEVGGLFRSETLVGLAKKIDIDAAGLTGTVRRWNEMCVNGIDEDFQKGGNVYNRFFGDHNIKPNPNMGPIRKAPYYAIKIYPGDLGTKGGLLTDEFSRVLKKDGTIFEGLYGAGNTTASVMGRTYLGAGSTLGPALTFAYIAINHIASKA